VRRCSSSKAGPRGMSRCPGPGLRVYELTAGPCEGFGRLGFEPRSKVSREQVDYGRASGSRDSVSRSSAALWIVIA